MEPILATGDTGFAVLQLQKQLTSLGFTCAADGDFGPATELQVRAFQTARGLDVDGKVGSVTRAALTAPVTAPTMADRINAMTVLAQCTVAPTVWSPDGWHADAVRCPLVKGRTGGDIGKPRTIVVHTTDTPGSHDKRGGSMAAILKKWNTIAADGAGATFMIGALPPTDASRAMQYPDRGLVQMASIHTNANHAGGERNGQPFHGWYLVNGKQVHPNRVSVGIEIENPGRVSRQHGVWYHADSGHSFDDEDVYVDALGHGWVKLTAYQVSTLLALIFVLRPQLDEFGPDVKLRPNGDWTRNGSPHAAVTGAPWLLGHYTLDPNNKTDPGPEVMELLREHYGI